MNTLSPPSPLIRPRSCRQSNRIQCIYKNDSLHFPNGVGFTRADWQSSFAILSSKVVSQEQSAEHIASVNGHKTSIDLNLLPVDKTNSDSTTGDNKPQLPSQKPLTITDLSPAPMHGSQLRVAYQGVPGAYSEAAAGKAYPNCEAIPCDQFEVAFQAVELWIADRAVLPVENSLGGSIHRNYDLLLRHRLHIVGEVQLPVHHCLLALPGVRKEYLTRVISHPQALAQCEHTLTKLGLNVAREAVDDTAGAAEYISTNNLRDTAAIASARAAELYGMQVMADGIQDDSGNVTRFVMLAREPIIPKMKATKGKGAVKKDKNEVLKPVEDRVVGKRKAALKASKSSSKPAKKVKPAKKDPNKPKRPSTAFFVFLEEFRKVYKQQHPNVKAVSAVGKAGGEKWKSLTDAI